MAPTLDRELRKQLDALARTEPDRLLLFVVTLGPGARVADLQARGLRIESEVPMISVVTVTMTARQALDLAAADHVVKIELDNQGVRALASPSAPSEKPR